MYILSVLCLLLLIPYLLVGLAFMPKGKGKQLFNMVYSAVALGGVGGLLYVFCRQYVNDYKGYVQVGAERLDTMLGALLLMIPVIMALVILNMVLKKPRGVLLFFIAAGLALADGIGVCIYAWFASTGYASFLPMILPASVLLVLLLWALAAGGLLPFEGKLGRAVHWTIQTVLFLAVAGLMGYGAYTLQALMGGWNASLFIFAPIALVGLIIPGIPLVLFFYDMVKRSDRPARVSRKQRKREARAK